MSTVDGNLKTFTKCAKVNIVALTCHKERTYNLLINLFTTYKANLDKELRFYAFLSKMITTRKVQSQKTLS